MIVNIVLCYVKVYFDCWCVIQLFNLEGGIICISKYYDSIRCSIIYDDIEVGSGVKVINVIVSGIFYGNMGDLFVMDFFLSVLDDEIFGVIF